MRTLSLNYESDIEIVEEYVSTGSDKAANAFIRKYQKFVFSTAFRYLKDHEDAEDISQEIFIKALRGLKGYKGNSSLSTWLYRITKNTCLNFIRKKKLKTFVSYSNDGEEFYDLASKDINAQQQMESDEFKNEFLKAMNSLPEKQRETFALRYYEELSYEEMSEMLGTSVGGLKANCFQAVKKLSSLLKDLKWIILKID